MSALEVRVHRGSHEIGGNCVELRYDNQTILLDVGLPLNNETVELPNAIGIGEHGRLPLAAIITHGHLDHWGLGTDGQRLDAQIPHPHRITRLQQWKAKPGAHQGVTVSMKRPVGKEAENSNAGGLKHEQYFPWGTDDWCAANGMRNGVESVNRNLKRSQYEEIADPDKRAVRGNTFTYLVVALATVVENLRNIMSPRHGR
jgi:hypothetical protein